MYELIFVIFLLSGILKQFFLLFNLSIPDITLLTLIILATYQVICLKKNSKIIVNTILKKALYLFLLIFILLMFSSFYSVSDLGKYYKLFLYLMVVYSFLVPFGKRDFNISLFFKYLIYVSIILAVMYIIYFPKIFLHDYKDLENSVKSLYLTMAHLSGLAILILLSFNNLFNYKLNLFFILILLVVIIISGARAPLLFLIVSVILFFMINNKKALKYIPIIFVVIVSISLIYYYMFSEDYNDMLTRSIHRFSLLFSDEHGHSIDTRIKYIDFTLAQIFTDIKSFLFGLGINSYGIVSTGYDIFSHPHNMFLEIFFEIGFFGLLVFLWLFLQIGKYMFYHDKTLFPIFLYLIFNSLKSSSYSQSRILFAILGVVVLIIIYKVKTKKSLLNNKLTMKQGS